MSRGGLRPEIPSGNFSIARAVFETVQGFRGKYFAGDSEICWRVRAAGHEIVFDPAAIVTHANHAIGRISRERLSRGCDFGGPASGRSSGVDAVASHIFSPRPRFRSS